MNKAYLVSLAGYLVTVTAVFLILSMLLSHPLTLSGFTFNLIIGVVLHRFFVWNRVQN